MDEELPVLPGFRQMAQRRKSGRKTEGRMADEGATQIAAEMAAEREALVRELAAQRQAAGLSQTEVAAMMGTSQSAVARLETGTADVRASTLERYAAVIGSQLRQPAQLEEKLHMPVDAHIPPGPAGPGEPYRPGGPFQPSGPGIPGGPGLPGWIPPLRPAQDPISPARVWADPHADWEARLHERLLAKRIVFAAGFLDDTAATRLSAQLLTLDAEGDEPVRLELQNLRAELSAVMTLMGILDVMHVPVHGCVSGEIAGPALGLLVACRSRSAYPNATLTLSEPRMELAGTASAITTREQQVVRMLDTLYFRLSEVTGREVDDIREDARRGRVLTSAQAIGYGLIQDQEALRK
jgi:ATP-dependent Clp protease, protease subunit